MSSAEIEVIDAEIVAVDGAAPARELVPLKGTLTRIDEPAASAELDRRVHDAWSHPRRRTCTCGNVTDYGHGGFSCEEILDIRARVEYGQRVERMSWWQRFRDRRNAPTGWPR